MLFLTCDRKKVINKLFERAMCNKVYPFLCKFELINWKQCGFRANHSTEHALISLIKTIKCDCDNGLYVYGIFVDLEKISDTGDHQMLLPKLSLYEITGLENKWFLFFLTQRKQYISIIGFLSHQCCSMCCTTRFCFRTFIIFIINYWSKECF